MRLNALNTLDSVSWKKSKYLVFLVVSPQTQVAVLCCAVCREYVAGRNRKWRVLCPVCRCWSPSWPGGRSRVQSPGVVPRSGTLPSLNSVNGLRECRRKPADQRDLNGKAPPFFLLYQSKTSVSKHHYLPPICGVGVLTPGVILGLILHVWTRTAAFFHMYPSPKRNPAILSTTVPAKTVILHHVWSNNYQI